MLQKPNFDDQVQSGGSGYELERKFTKFVEITQSQSHARRSRSFKVTDFSTTRKLINDFLLVINTNLPPILHLFQVTVKFSLARGVPHFNALARGDPLPISP